MVRRHELDRGRAYRASTGNVQFHCGGGRGMPRSMAAALRASLSWPGALKRFAISSPPSACTFYIPRGNPLPPPWTVRSCEENEHSNCPKYCFCTREIRQGSGCVLAEYQRPAPRKWRETAKRFKVPDRLRVARRAAAMEPGHTRIPAGMEKDVGCVIPGRVPPEMKKER